MNGAEGTAANTVAHTADTPQLLLEHHLKELRLPTILREYDKVARQCAVERLDYQRYLLRMTELELLDRERRATERRIRQAKFPVVKTMDSFDFLAMPSVNKTLVLELARCEFLARRENVLLLGNSGTGKTHIALALGLAACQRGHRVRFTTTAALVSELIEARDERKLLRFQKQIASYELLIVDKLGFVPLSRDRRRTALRDAQPALRARLDPDHLEPALPGMDRGPPERAAGQKGRFRYAPAPLLPRNPTTTTQLSYWPTITPPRWPVFTPPLTWASLHRGTPAHRALSQLFTASATRTSAGVLLPTGT